MNNINTIERAAYIPNKSNKWRNFKYGVVLFSLFNFSSPANAQNINSNGNNTSNIELSIASTNNKEKSGGYSLPPVYKAKIETILRNKLPVIEYNGTNSWMFTRDFVQKEMESDRGISKDNQLLFIWNNVCKQLTGEYVYKGDDGDSKRTEEFQETFRSAYLCGKRYREGIMPFIEKQSAEYDKRIADAQQRSADAQQRSAEYDRQIAQNKQQIAQIEEKIRKGEELLKQLNERNKMTKNRIMQLDSIGLRNMAEFYIVYTSNSDIIDDSVVNIDRMNELSKIFINDCKNYGINYKNVLMNEVKTREGLDDVKAKRKVDEMLKFYDVE